MAFSKVGSLDAHGAPILRREILTNSITTTVLDSVKFASGFVALGTTGAPVLGHVMQITTDFGVGVNTTGVAGAALGSYVGTFLTASDNQTVAKVRADIDVSQHTLYSAELDAAIGTGDSDLAGFRMDLLDEDTLSESSVGTATDQYATWGTDPGNSAQAIVNILESQVFNFS